MKFKLTTSIIVVFLLGCKSDHSKNLTKISPTEYILLYEEYKFPNIDSLLIKDENNNRMHRPRLQHLLLENKIFIDLYKNKEGKIVEGIARKITDADQMIYDQVFKIDLSSLEKKTDPKSNQLKIKGTISNRPMGQRSRFKKKLSFRHRC